MARRTRTLEILTAAGLVPQQLAVEQARGARDARVAQALASLVPSTINAGAGALGKLADYQAEQDLLALKRDNLAAKGETDKAAAASQVARADAMKAKAEADRVKAVAEAAEAARKAEGEASKTTAEQSMAALRSAAGAPGASLETLIGRASVDPGLGNLDDTAVAGILAEEQAKARKEGAGATLAERKATAPLGPKPKSPEEIERQRKRDEKMDLDIEVAKQALRGDKPMAPSDNERKVQNDVDSLTQNISKLEGDISNVNASGLEPGLIAGPARAAYATVFGDEKWTDFESTRDAVNLQIFGTLRSDAPSEEENKQAAKLKIGQSDNLETIRAKLRTIKALLDAKRRKPGSRLDELINDLRGERTPAPRPAGAPKPVSEMTDEELEAELAGGG